MRAVFLDKDGVINEDVDFLHRIEDLKFIPRAVKALVKLSESFPADKFKIIIASNQPVIGRGICTEKEFDEFTKKYFEELGKESKGKARIDDYFYCPHHPTKGIGKYKVECDCRKPKPGLLFQAEQKYKIDLQKSFMVGDKRSDIVAGQSAGCFSILVKTGYGGKGGEGDEAKPDAECKDLYDAVELILKMVKKEK